MMVGSGSGWFAVVSGDPLKLVVIKDGECQPMITVLVMNDG